MSSYKYLAILGILTILCTTVAGDENIALIAPIDHLPKDLTIGYPCKSQGDCGEGVCKFGLKLEKNKTVDVCECSEGWINFDGKACSYELKSKLTAFLLSFFIGWLGADWFYLAQGSGAYICAGIFKLITLGGLGVWFLIDWIRILADGFTDGNGMELRGW
jgi:hypothetical protein